MSDRAGKVILLNGTSSSGKSTIAKELRRVLPEPYLYVSIDEFLHQLPVSVLEDGGRLAHEWPNAAIARAGNRVIVDTVLQEPAAFRKLRAQAGR